MGVSPLHGGFSLVPILEVPSAHTEFLLLIGLRTTGLQGTWSERVPCSVRVEGLGFSSAWGGALRYLEQGSRDI